MGNTVDKPPQETCEDVEEQQEDDETTFTCEICIEQVNSGQKFKNHNKKCLHRSYCSDCIAKYIEVKLQEYNMSEIKCPGLDCVELLDPLVCQSILPKTVLVRWFDSLCESTVSKYQRVHCPFQECSALILNECGGKVMKSKCPDCKKLLCFECKLPWHAGYRCNESGQLRDRNDVLLGVLMETRQWKKCPVCNQGVELRSGCSIVRCRCGSKFCYKCGRSWCSCRLCDCIVRCVIVFFCLFLVLIVICGYYKTGKFRLA